MAQIRFQMQGQFAGSAAHDAENKENSRTMDFRVSAGSAARDAEERKRAEVSGPSSAGFSLRAQNGSIQRIGSSEHVCGAVTPSTKTNSIAAYKASDSEGVASAYPSASASADTCDSSAASSVPAPPAANTSSILQRLFPTFGKNS